AFFEVFEGLNELVFFAGVGKVHERGDHRLGALVSESLGYQVSPGSATGNKHSQPTERFRLSRHIPHSLDIRSLATPEASECLGNYVYPGRYPASPILTLLVRRRKTGSRRGVRACARQVDEL